MSTHFGRHFSLTAILEMHLSTNANKRDLFESSHREWFQSAVLKQLNQLQASNTISFASLSAHCHHSDCVDRSVVHLGKTATKQRNLLMDDIYLEDYLNLKIVCSCNNKPKTSHIFCPFQVLKEELY